MQRRGMKTDTPRLKVINSNPINWQISRWHAGWFVSRYMWTTESSGHRMGDIDQDIWRVSRIIHHPVPWSMNIAMWWFALSGADAVSRSSDHSVFHVSGEQGRVKKENRCMLNGCKEDLGLFKVKARHVYTYSRLQTHILKVVSAIFSDERDHLCFGLESMIQSLKSFTATTANKRQCNAKKNGN